MSAATLAAIVTAAVAVIGGQSRRDEAQSAKEGPMVKVSARIGIRPPDMDQIFDIYAVNEGRGEVQIVWLGFSAEQPSNRAERADITGIALGKCEAFIEEGPKLPFMLAGSSQQNWIVKRSGELAKILDSFSEYHPRPYVTLGTGKVVEGTF